MIDRADYNVEYRTCGEGGKTRWVNAVGRFVYDEGGSPVRFDGITIDISDRKRAEQALLARSKRDALLLKIEQIIRLTTDPNEIQAKAVTELGTVLAADHCYFAQYDMAQDVRLVQDDFHLPNVPSIAGEYRLSQFNAKLEDLYVDGSALVVADVAASDLPPTMVNFLTQQNIGAMVAVPFHVSHRLVATLNVVMMGPRNWHEEEVELIEAVATQTRLAVQAARLAADEKAKQEREALISRITLALRTLTDPTEIQATAVRLVGEALRADRCYFAVYDLASETVRVAADFHIDGIPSIQGVHRFANTREMFEELYGGSNVSVVNDTGHSGLSQQTRASVEGLQLRSCVSVAVIDGTGLHATLTAAMSGSPREWTDDDIALIEVVASHMRAAVELANVQQREHRIATELQSALQPSVPNGIPNLKIASQMRPALDEASVGGDFFDVFPLDKTLYAIVVGDVSGKGLAAATQHATVRNMLRSFLYQYRNAAEAVSTT
jgi:GAF domain-containing protein